MAAKNIKQAVETNTAPKSALNESVDDAFTAIGPGLNIEDMIADQLLDHLDWQKVRAALIRKAPAKLFAWLTNSNNPPINISQFPELSALPSSRDGEAA